MVMVMKHAWLLVYQAFSFGAKTVWLHRVVEIIPEHTRPNAQNLGQIEWVENITNATSPGRTSAFAASALAGAEAAGAAAGSG